MGGRSADEHAHLERAAFFDCLLVVARDVPLYLVVQPAFVCRIVVAGDLHAVHAQVRLQYACMLAWARCYLRERHEGAAVFGPAYDLREVGQRAFLEVPEAARVLRERAEARFCRPE